MIFGCLLVVIKNSLFLFFFLHDCHSPEEAYGKVARIGRSKISLASSFLIRRLDPSELPQLPSIESGGYFVFEFSYIYLFPKKKKTLYYHNAFCYNSRLSGFYYAYYVYSIAGFDAKTRILLEQKFSIKIDIKKVLQLVRFCNTIDCCTLTRARKCSTKKIRISRFHHYKYMWIVFTMPFVFFIEKKIY